MLAETERKLIASFMEFLRQRVSQLGEDNSESVEVAIQCLEAALGGSVDQSSLGPLPPLLDLCQRWESARTVSPEDETRAEALKGEGNDLMKEGKHAEALAKYSAAIAIRSSPVYHCNRAAAYTKLDRFGEALADCESALALDPAHSKAYARMGLVHSTQNSHQKAVDAYRRALELDPGNASYTNNLGVAQQKLAESTGGGGGGPGAPGGMPGMGGIPGFPGFPGMGAMGPGGVPDMSALLSNPALMNMATQMMSNPGVQDFMASLMQNVAGGPPGTEGTGPGPIPPGPVPAAPTQEPQGGPPMGPQGLAGLMEAGQQLASQMQAQNPELVEQLRTAFQQQRGPSDAEPPSNNPNDNSNPGGPDKKD